MIPKMQCKRYVFDVYRKIHAHLSPLKSRASKQLFGECLSFGSVFTREAQAALLSRADEKNQCCMKWLLYLRQLKNIFWYTVWAWAFLHWCHLSTQPSVHYRQYPVYVRRAGLRVYLNELPIVSGYVEKVTGYDEKPKIDGYYQGVLFAC